MAENHHDENKTQTHIPLMKETTIGHYRIIEKIGAGGMGEVYLAEDTELNRKVALKFLPPRLCQDDECRARFKREAQAAAKLDHPNIVTVHEVGEHQGRPYFAMAHVEGQSLKELSSGKELSIEQILELGIQICEGLQAAHDKGITHRDIKPSNILIDSHGRVRIVDFGLASVVGKDQLTKTGSTLGTVGYMSPEQVRGQQIDHRTDLFSLGVVLYELITKQNPFKRDSDAATLKAVSDETPHPVARYRSDVTDELQTIIEKSLEKNVEMRFQTASGLTSELKRLARELPQDLSTITDKPSIAVLPFANLSADPEQEYFCDGMAEEIINALAHVENLRVVARTSCFAFKGRQDDIRNIGRKLDVSTLLEGSVRKAGNRLRITAQLINVSNGYHLWSERYDRELSDIFVVQDEIAIAIVNKLKVKLLGSELEQIVRRPTENLKAYGLYLKGRYHWNKRASKEVQRAIVFLKRAVELDSQLALGYAGLADAYIIQSDNTGSYEKRSALLESAEKAVSRALELDESLGEAHTALAQIRFAQWKWREVEKEHNRAIELNPRYATARHWYSLFLVARGQFEQAWEQIKLARELDPLSPSILSAQAICSYLWRRYDMTIEICREGFDITPDFPMHTLLTGWSLLEKGNCDKAINQFHRYARLREAWWEDEDDYDSALLVSVGMAFVKMGEHAKANDILETIVKKANKGRGPLFSIAILYFALGNADQGFKWMEQSVEKKDFWLPLFRFSPGFDSFRDDPRFASLMKRVGLDQDISKPSHE